MKFPNFLMFQTVFNFFFHKGNKEYTYLPEYFFQAILGEGEPVAVHLTEIEFPIVVIISEGCSCHFGGAKKVNSQFQNRKTKFTNTFLHGI